MSESVALIPDTSFTIPTSSPVTGRVSGMIVDENEAPVENATVVLAGVTYLTDARGIFDSNESSLDKYVTTVTVTKNGYFKASDPGVQHPVEIMFPSS